MRERGELTFMTQVAATADVDLLARAVARGVPVRLNAVVNAQEQTFRARVVRLEGDVGGGSAAGFWVHLLENRRGTDLLERAMPVCCGTFAVDQARYTFRAQVLRRDRHLWANQRAMFDALLLSPPEELRRIDQRGADRLAISENSGVTAQLCRMVPDVLSANGRRAVPLAGALQDLSAAGAGFICRANRHLTESRPDEPMVCLLHFRGRTFTLAARLTQVSVISHRTTRAGIVFDWQDLQTRHNLPNVESVIAELQRQVSQRRPRRTT
jgi:hypothetical protein